MKPMSNNQNTDELALCRVLLDEAMDRRDTAESEAQWLKYDAACAMWLDRILNMIQHNAILGKDTRTAFVTIMDYIRVANEKQGVIR